MFNKNFKKKLLPFAVVTSVALTSFTGSFSTAEAKGNRSK